MKKYILIVLTLMVAMANAGTSDPANYHSDRLLVCFQPDVYVQTIDLRGTTPVVGIASVDYLLSRYEIASMKKYLPGSTEDQMDGDIILSHIFELTLAPGKASLTEMMADFEAEKSILYAERVPIMMPHFTPNDSRFGTQWYLPKIGAPDAWDFWDIDGGERPGNTSIVMASVDTGVQYYHPDLWKRAWINQDEIPSDIFDAVDTDSDGVVTPIEVVAHLSDYDSNGLIDLRDAMHSSSPFMDGLDGDDWDNNPATYIDDLLGWDAAGTSSTSGEDNDPIAAFSGSANLSTRMHGTHVAGLLAAESGNGTGIASSIYNGSFMSVKVFIDQSSGGISNGPSGMLYAAGAGADVVNMSYGGPGYSTSTQAIVNVCHNTYGAILVSSAGNGNDDGSPSGDPAYPSGYDNVVSVTAVGSGDNFSWAHYGDGEGNTQFFGVDMSAPGENILSTVFTTSNGGYSSWDGTSMSSPIAASCFGLLKSAYPGETNDWYIEAILSTTDDIDHLNPNFAGQLGTGRINIHKALGHLIYPSLSYDSYSLNLINDSGDGLLSPGDGARMRVNLFNEPGWVDAVGVTAILRSNSEFITVVDSTGAYTDINSGNIGVNITDRYEFSVASDAPSGQFPMTLSIIANTESDRPYTVEVEFNIEVSIWQANFPLASSIIKGGNAVVDLDGDGSKEIIYAAYDSLLHAVNADGDELPGFPVLLDYLLEATPAVGDIDNDGDLEVVVGSLNRNLYVVQHDGSSEMIYTGPGFILAPSTLYDLDGDGDLEIVLPTVGADLAVIHHDGTPLPNFPMTLDHNMTAGAAIGDINADGNIDIVVGTWADKLHAINLDGSEVTGFPVELTDKIRSAPILMNIDNSSDHTLEILFGCDDNKFHAYDATGTELWFVTTSGQNIQADPAACDMDGDGDLEIIFGGLDRLIYAVDHTGSFLDGWPVGTGGAIYSSPAIADIDNDGLAEVFIGSNDRYLYGFHLDGSSIGGFPAENTGNIQASPSIADLDGDGDIEIITGSDNNLLVLDLPTMGDVAGYWPTHRGSLHRTGVLPTVVSVSEGPSIPEGYSLSENFPNPFNPTTQINFTLPEAIHVNLQVLDIRGRLVDELASTQFAAGQHSVIWTGMQEGRPADAGVYFYRLSSQQGTLVRKMTLLK